MEITPPPPLPLWAMLLPVIALGHYPLQMRGIREMGMRICHRTYPSLARYPLP